VNNVIETLKIVVMSIVGILILGVLLVVCVFLSIVIPPLDPPPKEEDWPSWAPDGQQMVYECYLDGPVDRPDKISCLNGGPCLPYYTPDAADLCISNVNKHDQVRLTNALGGDWRPIWSPDGSQIAYLRDDGIYLITPEGQNQHQLVPIDLPLAGLSWWGTNDEIITWSSTFAHFENEKTD
jgi:hypothetical protein